MSSLSPEVLASCLDRVQAGESTVEECLAAHPEFAEELGGLIRAALAIAPPPAVEPDPHFRSRARSTLLTTIALEQGQAENRTFLRRVMHAIFGRPSRTGPIGRPAEMPLPVFLALAILVGAGSAGVSLAAEEALPGEPLYALKTVTEVVRLSLAPSDAARAELNLLYASRRLDEMERLRGRLQIAQYQTTAERYAYHVEQATEIGKKTALGDEVAVLVQRLALRRQVWENLLQAGAPDSAVPALAKAMTRTDAIQQVAPPPKAVAASAPAAPAVATPTAAVSAAVANAEASESLADLSKAVAEVVRVEVGLADGGAAMATEIASAKTAVEQGQPELAANNLSAFIGRLGELQRAGKIKQESFQALYNSYSEAVSCVNAAMVAKAAEKAKGNNPSPVAPASSQNASHSAPTATSTVPPTATPKPLATLPPTASKAPAATPANPERRPTPTPKS